jgi:hypothetical protein
VQNGFTRTLPTLSVCYTVQSLSVEIDYFTRFCGYSVDALVKEMRISPSLRSAAVLWAFFRTGYPPIAVEDFGDSKGGNFEVEPEGAEENCDPTLPIAVLDYVAQMNDASLWKVAQSELGTFRQGTNGRTMLHRAANLGSVELLQQLMKRKVNPFVPSRRGNVAINVAANDEVRGLLRDYMKWDPTKPEMQDWYDPIVHQRAMCFLLLCKRYESYGLKKKVPKDVKGIILGMIVGNEVLYLKRGQSLQEFRS